MKRTLLFSLVFGLVIMASPALAADWYVDADNGTDGSDCTESSTPCQGINYILGGDSFASGDTIYLKGTFTFDAADISITSSASGTITDFTTITNWPGESPIIDGTGNNTSFILGEGTNYFQISGLDFKGADYAAIDVQDNNTGIAILNNKFHDSTGRAVKADSTTRLVMVNNLAYNNTGENDSVVDLDSVTQAIILNNTFHNNAEGGTSVLDIVTCSGTIIYNNTFTTFDTGIDIDTNSISATLLSDYNNFYGGNSSDFYVTSLGAPLSLDGWKAAYAQDTNSVTVDPIFYSTTLGSEDLHLQSTSPLIDIGTTPTIEGVNIEVDYDREARVYGPSQDIGADEHPMPATPTDLSFDPAAKKLTLSWLLDESYEASGYVVKFGTDEDLTGSDVTEEDVDNNAVYEITDLKAGKSYYYTVRTKFTSATEADYYSDYADIEKITTLPAKVKKLKAPKKKRLNKKATVTWKKYKRSNGQIKLMNKKGKKIKLISVSKKKAKKGKTVIKNLKAGKKYKIKMRARRNVGGTWYPGKWSNTVTFSTAAATE